jgi:hypothetical protein
MERQTELNRLSWRHRTESKESHSRSPAPHAFASQGFHEDVSNERALLFQPSMLAAAALHE